MTGIVAEIGSSLRALVGVLRFDPAAPKAFGNTPLAVWVSLAMAVAAVVPQWMAMPLIVIVRPQVMLLSVIELLLWPVLAAEICRRVGRFSCFCRYVAAYNWLVLVKALVMVAVLVLPVSAGEGPGSPLFLVVVVLSMIYEGFIARHALEIPTKTAVIIVVFNVAVRWALLLFSGILLFRGTT